MELENNDKQGVINNGDESSVKDKNAMETRALLETPLSSTKVDDDRSSTKKQKSFILRGFITVLIGIILIPITGIYVSTLVFVIGVGIVVVGVLIKLDERKQA